MRYRERAIVEAILKAILNGPRKYSLLKKLWALFAIFYIPLERFEHDQFRRLRETWKIEEDQYWQSFQTRNDGSKRRLISLSELGYSGSTFFETLDYKYIIKSLPRESESEFFKEELREPYYNHMQDHPGSLLVRMTDFLHCPIFTVGGFLQLVPRHHVVMENVLSGKEADPLASKWETYDLKPANYFYPERDVLDGQFASAEAQNKIVDYFKDKIRITQEEWLDLKKTIDTDTEFLKQANTVDYSILLVRYPSQSSVKAGGTWRTGIISRDQEWVYRAVILDFFWSKHKLPAKAMTALIKTYNTFDDRGPMSLTTSAAEFKTRFCTMVEAFVDAV